MQEYKNITLLVTHFNRSKSLERLLFKFKNLSISFGGIVVSDDGSKPEHLAYLKELQLQYNFRVITTPINKGLGNNINKGQDAVETPFTLYVQEDFVPKPAFVKKLSQASDFMEEDKEIDFVRFYGFYIYPHLKTVKNGFSEMIFKHSFIWEGYRKFFYYSDQPHLRRTNFFKKYGRYDEGIKPDRTEYNMMMTVLSVGVKGYFCEDFTASFDHDNSTEEPSMIERSSWRGNTNVFVSISRHIYRYIRFNLELIIFKLRHN